ncbi:MAG: hypothetical protein ACREMY_03325 [bacterium]
MYASVGFSTCSTSISGSLHPFRRRLKVGLLSSTLASIADSLVAEGLSDLIYNQVTLHTDAICSMRRPVRAAKFAFFSSKNAVFLLPQMTLPIAFHSWFFIKQKEIDRSTSPAI